MLAVPTEYSEQVELFKWARLVKTPLGPLSNYMFAIPNEGKRSHQTAARLKAQGLRPGIPDVMIALPMNGKPGLFIEMKRQKGSKVSDNQKRWLDRLSRAGYVTAVALGFEQAREIVERYLEGGSLD